MNRQTAPHLDISDENHIKSLNLKRLFLLRRWKIFEKTLNNKQQQGDELRICCQKLCTPNSPENFQLPKLQNDRLNNLDFKSQEIPIRNQARSKCNASYRETERESKDS
jgi:hypothetical protein